MYSHTDDVNIVLILILPMQMIYTVAGQLLATLSPLLVILLPTSLRPMQQQLQVLKKLSSSRVTELSFPPSGPTPIYEDSKSVIQIINHCIPTEHSHHIDIQLFGIQSWTENGDLIMCNLPGVVNPSDDLTKYLGWILHACHTCHTMGHYSPWSCLLLLPLLQLLLISL